MKSRFTIKEGYLMKKNVTQGFNKIMGWKQRYFRLKNDSLTWSVNNSETSIRNQISLLKIDKCVNAKKLKIFIVIYF